MVTKILYLFFMIGYGNFMDLVWTSVKGMTVSRSIFPTNIHNYNNCFIIGTTESY